MTMLAMWTMLMAVFMGVANASAPTVRVGSNVAQTTLEGLADFVIDLDSSHFQITDVDDEDEETNQETKPLLCIAPPCGLRADAVPLTSLPVPWAMRIKAPELA